MTDRQKRLVRTIARATRRRPVLRWAVGRFAEAVRSRPVLVDALSRLAQLEGDDRILPLATPVAAVEARRRLHPEDPGPDRWPVVGVETHHLGAGEEGALAAVVEQQRSAPWFRPVFLTSESAVEAVRATGCPFDLVPTHDTSGLLVGQRVADLLTGFGATLVVRAEREGLPAEHLVALGQIAARRRAATRRVPNRSGLTLRRRNRHTP